MAAKEVLRMMDGVEYHFYNDEYNLHFNFAFIYSNRPVFIVSDPRKRQMLSNSTAIRECTR